MATENTARCEHCGHPVTWNDEATRWEDDRCGSVCIGRESSGRYPDGRPHSPRTAHGLGVIDAGDMADVALVISRTSNLCRYCMRHIELEDGIWGPGGIPGSGSGRRINDCPAREAGKGHEPLVSLHAGLVPGEVIGRLPEGEDVAEFAATAKPDDGLTAMSAAGWSLGDKIRQAERDRDTRMAAEPEDADTKAEPQVSGTGYPKASPLPYGGGGERERIAWQAQMPVAPSIPPPSAWDAGRKPEPGSMAAAGLKVGEDGRITGTPGLPTVPGPSAWMREKIAAESDPNPTRQHRTCRHCGRGIRSEAGLMGGWHSLTWKTEADGSLYCPDAPGDPEVRRHEPLTRDAQITFPMDYIPSRYGAPWATLAAGSYEQTHVACDCVRALEPGGAFTRREHGPGCALLRAWDEIESREREEPEPVVGAYVVDDTELPDVACETIGGERYFQLWPQGERDCEPLATLTLRQAAALIGCLAAEVQQAAEDDERKREES